MAGITEKSLNAFYYACPYAKADYSRFMGVTASLALGLVPASLQSQPLFFCVYDTIAPKSGKKFEDVSKLFDHAAHNGSNYLNGHCFVSLMLCVPVWKDSRVTYLSVPLGYRIWQKKETKLQMAASMVRQAMPVFALQKSVIVLCDSWYAKKDLLCIVDEYPNLDIICKARCDSALYGQPPKPTGKRGRPAKRGARLSLGKDFSLSDEKVGAYHIAVRRVLTNLFGQREVLAYVTAVDKTGSSRRLFFSTVFPERLQIFCAWQEKEPLNQTGVDRMKYIPLFCYAFRWNIEVSYYEQKMFWSLCHYLVRSRKGIELLVNLATITYCAMKILPYQDGAFAQYCGESVQEFRFVLSGKIREQVFYATFVKNIETSIKSASIVKAIKQLIQQKGLYI